MAAAQDKEDLERSLILEYEQFAHATGQSLFQDMPELKKAALRKQRAEALRQQERFQRIPPDVQEREIDAAIIQEIARQEAPPYEKWRIRKQAQQAVLAFADPDAGASENIA